MSEVDLDHLRNWIGREEAGSELVTASLVERFIATFDDGNSIGNGEAAPRLIHLCLAPPAAPASRLGADGHPTRGGFLPPVPLPRRMWAGGAFAFHGEILVGDLVLRRSTIRDIAIKQGRSGALCFVTVDHTIESNGRLAVEERQDIVYRGTDGSGGIRNAPAPAPHGAHRRTVVPSPTLLFRYSALTFNGHRIHYDAPYAREVENYPGLVIHGPLQATMLARFAETLRGRPPVKFRFRSLSPLFDDADFTLNATADGDHMRLWTARTGGPVAMEAQAEW